MSDEREVDDGGQRELDLRVGFGLFTADTRLDSLLSIARRVDVEAGQLLFDRGEPTTTLFQVVVGHVELAAPERPTWNLRDGGAAGLLDFALGRPHARTARAAAPCQLIALDAAEYRDYLEENFEAVHRILAQLGGRLMADMSLDPARFLARASERVGRTYADVEIPFVDRLIMLSQMPPFRGTSTQALANLAHSATERRFAPGDVIAPAGAPSKLVSVLVEGTVDLAVAHGTARRTGRDFVADVDELSLRPRVTSTSAVTAAIVLQIESDDLFDRVEEHFDLATTLLAYVASEQQRVNEASPTGECRVA